MKCYVCHNLCYIFLIWFSLKRSIFLGKLSLSGIILTAPLVTATSSCANSLLQATNTGGIIESNYYRMDYSDNMDCEWNISSNSILRLVFVRFKTEISADYLNVYDGGSPSSPMIGRFSGSSIPAPLTSSTNQLYMRFTSDGQNVYPGFRAFYEGIILLKSSSLRSNKPLFLYKRIY